MRVGHAGDARLAGDREELCCDCRDGEPPPVVGEAAVFEAEFQAVASSRDITAEAAARFSARPGLRFPRIADISPCEVAVALGGERGHREQGGEEPRH